MCGSHGRFERRASGLRAHSSGERDESSRGRPRTGTRSYRSSQSCSSGKERVGYAASRAAATAAAAAARSAAARRRLRTDRGAVIRVPQDVEEERGCHGRRATHVVGDARETRCIEGGVGRVRRGGRGRDRQAGGLGTAAGHAASVAPRIITRGVEFKARRSANGIGAGNGCADIVKRHVRLTEARR